MTMKLENNVEQKAKSLKIGTFVHSGFFGIQKKTRNLLKCNEFFLWSGYINIKKKIREICSNLIFPKFNHFFLRSGSVHMKIS